MASRTKLATEIEELARVAVGLEADHIAGQEPLADRPPQALQEELPLARGRPRDVVEVEDRRPGKALADPLAAKVEVVVLEQEDRAGITGGRFDGGVGEADVDRPVAVAPGVEQGIVDVRAVGRCVHLVMDEPQERVGDDPVVAVVLGVRDRDVDKPQVLAGEVLMEQRPNRATASAAVGLRAVRAIGGVGTAHGHPTEHRPDAAVGRRHGRGDQGHGGVATQLGEGGDQAAGAAHAERRLPGGRQGRWADRGSRPR